jgi:hypothetical protein
MSIDDELANLGHHSFDFGEIDARDDGINAGMLESPIDFDRFDHRMSMGAAQHSAVQHSGKGIVRTVERAAGDFLHPVMSDGASADDPEIAVPGTVGICHEITYRAESMREGLVSVDEGS